MFRKVSLARLKEFFKIFGKVIESGIFREVVSVAASKYSFVVTVVYTKNFEDVEDQICSTY
jgi:hypothetical protein